MNAQSSAKSRPIEVGRFLDTLDSLPPGALTACPGWTAHQLGAHLAGTYREMARHVEAHTAGRPLTNTRAFDEREPEFQAMAFPDLIRAIDEGEQRMRATLGELLDQDPDPVLRWTNRQVHAADFVEHGRSECAVHRRDLVGDDATSRELLSQGDLFEHVVSFIGPLPMTARGLAAGVGQDTTLSARIRAVGQPDLLVTVHRDQPRFVLADPEGEALIEGDPAARLLFLWGRRPTPFARLTCNGTAQDLSRIQRLLSGY